MKPRHQIARGFWWPGWIFVLGMTSLFSAADPPKHHFDLPADDAAVALHRFSETSGREILFSTEAVRGVRTNAVFGEFTDFTALARMVEGTALQEYQDVESGAFAVRRRPDARGTSVDPGSQAGPQDDAAARPAPIEPESTSMKRTTLLTLFAAWLGFSPGPATAQNAPDAAAPASAVVGRVSNRGTGAYLEGATVRVEGTRLEVITERDGYYRVELPPGAHTLVANYTGLDPLRTTVTLATGQTLTRDFELTTEIYQLAKVVVASEREGDALALTRQRQAPNVKNVVSADSFGSLAGNPADLLEHIPGITSDRVGGDVRFLQIRGVDGDLNSVQLDGNRIASTGADGRGFQFQNIGSDHIESMEVVKAPTPDIDADSIGGAINIRSRSGFDLKQRRITYSLGGILGYERDSPHFAGTFSYSDALSVFGGERNLGVSLDLGYRQHRATLDNVRQDFQNVTTSPAYRWRTEVRDFTNIRTRYGGGLKVDYKLSPDSSVYANFSFSPHDETGDPRIGKSAAMTMVLQSAQSIAAINPTTGLPTGTGAILPGYTDARTEVRPLSTSFMNLINQMHDRSAFSGSGQVGGRVRKRTWELEYDGSYSYARNELWNYQSTLTLRGLGWITDTTGRDRWTPAITFTSGPDSFNLDNFTENSLTHLETPIQNEIMGGQVNYRRKFDLAVPASVKTGLKYRGEQQERWNYNRRWNRVGPNGTPATARLSQFVDRDYNYAALDGAYAARPFPSTKALVDDLHANPQLWPEDVGYRVQQNLTGRRSLEENVLAAYLMGTVDLGRLSLLGGLRVEETDVSGTGAVVDLSPEERARRAAWQGPLTNEEIIRRTLAEYGGRHTVKRDYRNVFPGLHFKYEPLDRLIFRASYSTGIGRPAFTAITPNDTVFEDSQIVQASNPGLKPQYANNFDAMAEYYLKPSGVLSFGVFLKEISDFIYNSSGTIIPPGANNGFNGEYAGYELRTQANGGFAKIKGLEANYQQSLRFLPRWMQGFGVFANYTQLWTEGDYGDLGNVQRTGEIPGFKPKAANAGISYIRGKLNLRAIYNYNGRMLSVTNARDNLKQYRIPEERVDLKLKYIINDRLDVYLDVYNVFNSKWGLEYGSFDRPRQLNDRHDPQFHFGINGRL
jgi:iron complex outermembrane recepter protein